MSRLFAILCALCLCAPAWAHKGSDAYLDVRQQGVVDRIITNLGVLDVVEGGLRIVELADGVSEADLRAATEATIIG